MILISKSEQSESSESGDHSESAFLGSLLRILWPPLQKGEDGVLAAHPMAPRWLIPEQGLGVVVIDHGVERAGSGEFQWPE